MARHGEAISPGPGLIAHDADEADLRLVIAESLAASPVDEQRLRRGVWTFVGLERHEGTSPAHVIMALTELVDAAPVDSLRERDALTRRVILWCVEAYFGHLGGDVVGCDDPALSEHPLPGEQR